jgi:hypothetical protein
VRPPDEGQVEALAEAIDHTIEDIGSDGWLDYHTSSLALALLQRLPYGWELVKYTWTGDNDAKAP